ncbi:MAG: hypothetical protein QXV69_00765 [Sulfolobaceae archaeon]
MLFSVIALVFFIYGILTPLYYYILKGKLSNEKAFIITWITAPHLINYFYSNNLFQYLIVSISYILNILIIYFNKRKLIINGSTLLGAGVIIALFNNLN